jgi:hypothetical protein
VVDQVKKFVNGEMIAASFRNMVKVKQDEEEKKLEAELEEQRVKQAVKDQIQKKLTLPRVSVNESMHYDPQPLLSGDYDEETR